MSSRVFYARTGTGECYFCRANFATGERVFYMTAKALRDTPERPLTPREERAAAQHGRAVRAARANRETAPAAPAWLWERLVHAACARRAGFPVPGAATEARVGTRTVGHSHGVGVAGTPVTAPASAPVAPTATAVDPITAAVDSAARGTPVTVPPVAVAPERFNPYRSIIPAPVAPVAPTATAPGAALRARVFDLDPNPAPGSAPVNPEPGFKPRRLDLD